MSDHVDWTEAYQTLTLGDMSDLPDWTEALEGAAGGGGGGGGGPLVLISDASHFDTVVSPGPYATSIACPAPAGLVAGNTLVAVVTGSGFAGTFSAPAGWTSVGSGWPGTGQIAGFGVFTHPVGASEPGSYTFGYSPGVREPGIMILHYSGPHAASGVTLGGGSLSLLSSATAPAQTVTVAPAVVLAAYNSYQGYTWSTPTGTTLRLSLVDAGGLGFYLFEQAAPTAANYGPFTSTPSTATQWSSLSVQVA